MLIGQVFSKMERFMSEENPNLNHNQSRKMPNKNYLRGRRKEYKIMDELEKEGYPLVMRTAGSHSPVDVIAIKEMSVVEGFGLCFIGKLIQSKVGGKYKSVKKYPTTIETPNGSLIVERWEYPSNAKTTKKTNKTNIQPLKQTKRVEERRSNTRKSKAVVNRRSSKRSK